MPMPPRPISHSNVYCPARAVTRAAASGATLVVSGIQVTASREKLRGQHDATRRAAHEIVDDRDEAKIEDRIAPHTSYGYRHACANARVAAGLGAIGHTGDDERALR